MIAELRADPRVSVHVCETLGEFERHIAEASDTREGLERLDVDLDAVAAQLEKEGVAKFVEPFDKLQKWLEDRRHAQPAA